MKQAKIKKFPAAHTPKSNTNGMGDYYGTGIRQKVGRLIEGEGNGGIPKAKTKIPPRSLA